MVLKNSIFYLFLTLRTKNHLLELLSIALTPDVSTKTIRAYFFFCFNDDPSVFKALLANDFLPGVCELLLKNDTAPDNVIGRVATFTFNSFYSCPQESMQKITFVDQLLNYVYNPSVFAFFEKLFANDVRYETIQEWFISNSLPSKISELIISSLDKIDSQKQNSILMKNNNNSENIDKTKEIHEKKLVDKNPQFESSENNIDVDQEQLNDNLVLNVASLYKLITYGSFNMIMKSNFRSDSIISAVKRANDYHPSRIRDNKWAAIVSICQGKVAVQLFDYIDIAMMILIKPENELKNEIVFCINFLTLMLKNLPKEVGSKLESTQIFSVLMRIIIQFHDATILHTAFRVFVIACFQSKQLMPKVIASYVPIFIAEVRNPLNGLFYISCWQILLKIEEHSNKAMRKELEKIVEYEVFAKIELTKYKKKINSSYGGALPMTIPGSIPYASARP